MDIPLPDTPCEFELTTPCEFDPSLYDIPIPEDVNRYSPSLPIEDDPTEFPNDISEIKLPNYLPKTDTNSSKPVVLGKLAAKKRLLAFSAAKTNSATAALSAKAKKDEVAKDLAAKKKKRKKGVLDKARDTISEIEELKRRENEYQKSMQMLHPQWPTHAVPGIPASLLLKDALDAAEVLKKNDQIIEEILEKRAKKEKQEEEKRRKDEERRERRERQRKRDQKPKSWTDFKSAGHKAYHFRRVKYKWENADAHYRKKRRSRSKERDKRKKLNLLDTPMELKSPLTVETADGKKVEFPSWSVKWTKAMPTLSYSMNPARDRSRWVSRQAMLDSLPTNISSIVKRFLKSLRPKRAGELFRVKDFLKILKPGMLVEDSKCISK